MSLVPFGYFDNKMDSLFDESNWLWPWSDTLPTVREPSNVTRDKDAVHLHLAVPGFKKDELKIAVNRGILTVTGKITRKDKIEFFTNNFESKWRLNSDGDFAKISSKLEDGILTITIPFKVPEKNVESEQVVEIQ